jgi:hypothetical protein
MRTFQLTTALTAALLFQATAAHAQPGPGDEGAVLRNPFEDTGPRPAASDNRAAATNEGHKSGPSPFDQILAKLAIDPRFGINKDIEPTADLGPWMVCVMTYVKNDAPQMAREMCSELRSAYRLPAYVFTYGQDERRKEYERVKLLVDKQREFQEDKNLQFVYLPRAGKDSEPELQFSEDLPLHYAARLLRVRHIPLQCAVLVGGYADENAAHRALTAIRKLNPPDPNKVKVDTKYVAHLNKEETKVLKGEEVYVNPFPRAFLCRNPAAKGQSPAEKSQEPFDITVLKRLNADEPLTLLNCKKPITLAIKEFRTYTVIQDRERERSVLETLGFKTRAGEGIDQAAHDAHNLAETLRRLKIDAYALHTKFSSIVTVGGFDSLEDPNLATTQKYLERRLPELERQAQERSRSIQFFAKAMPMQVPR